MSKKFCFAFISSLFSLATFAQNYVTVYEDCNYRGRSFILTAGNYRTYQMKIGNDQLSSIQVPQGLRVTLYEHDNFSGASRTITSSTNCIESDWNDRTSSIVVENVYNNNNSNEYVTFYNDCYYKGYSRSLAPGTYTGPDLGNLRQNISSFSIYGNLRVRIYTNNDNASGYSVNLDESQSCLSGSYNDRIQSLVVEYKDGGWNNNNNNGGWNNNNNSNNYATIYADCNYRGNSLRLAPGYYQGDKLGLLRFDISSIEIPSNLRAKVYINNEYLSGNYYTITENTRCLSNTMNNRIGSLVIEENGYNNNNNNNNNNYPPYGGDDRVTIYTDENFRGQSVSLLPGTYYSMSQLGFPDNALSSLRLPYGYRVVLYEFEDFKGRSYQVNQTKDRFMFSGWNDRTSSIAVYRDR